MTKDGGWCGSSAGVAGLVMTWRRAQMVLLSAQGMGVPATAKMAFTSEDRLRDVIRNFNADGFGSLYPKFKGGRSPKFTLAVAGRTPEHFLRGSSSHRGIWFGFGPYSVSVSTYAWRAK